MSSVVPNLVEIRDLHFSYGKRSILSGLQMDFPRGKVIAVMGGSGSGKTTVLRLIGGQIRPQKGQVKVQGQVVHKLNTAGTIKRPARWTIWSRRWRPTSPRRCA